MLDAMKDLALDYLREQLPDDLADEQEPWEWYLQVREEHPELLFPYLIEAPRDSMSPNYYVLKADPQDPDVAILEQRECREGDELLLPFVAATGPGSGALGPVIKRTYSKSAGIGPSRRTNEITRKNFKKIAESEHSWSPYFKHVTEVISRPKLFFRDELIEDRESYALALAINKIGEPQTCFLSVLDRSGQLPGEVGEYLVYLEHVLSAKKLGRQIFLE